jgi:hypothetical protein
MTICVADYTSVAGAGAHNVVASYGGDTNFSGSTSSPQSLTAAPVNTTIALAGQPGASFSLWHNVERQRYAGSVSRLSCAHGHRLLHG